MIYQKSLSGKISRNNIQIQNPIRKVTSFSNLNTAYWLRFYIPRSIKQVISEMLFLPNLLTSTTTTTTTVLRAFFCDHPAEPVPEENFWTLWCKKRLTEADTSTILTGATPSGLTSAHLHHPPFFTGRMPFCRPTNSVKALKATS